MKPSEPAFPTGSQDRAVGSNGLTKREFFAAYALAGFCANNDLQKNIAKIAPGVDINEILASAARTAADALITELEKP